MNTSGKLTLSRREFFAVSALISGAWLTGCVTNPVSGRRQFSLVGAGEDLQLDRTNSPHQLSADYGAVPDAELNCYLGSVGRSLAQLSHRPEMPYSFQAVNAVYVNAYAFPGGTIAVTRGLMLAMDNEAQLAALLGHEIGHVCARHTAARMSKSMLAALGLSLTSAILEYADQPDWINPSLALGGVFSGALLARYSRANEREADELSLLYMTRAGYNPAGCVELMDILRSLSKSSPGLIETVFATHPMSEERYQSAVLTARKNYAEAAAYPVYRERYLDQTAGLRKMQDAITALQKGETAMNAGKLNDAEMFLTQAVKLAPADYAALLLLAEFRIRRKQCQEAEQLAAEAAAIYPQEPRHLFISGLAKSESGKFEPAYHDFHAYERRLPGNPTTTFFMGYSLEGMRRREAAAQHYINYLNKVAAGAYAEHARMRLTEWGYLNSG